MSALSDQLANAGRFVEKNALSIPVGSVISYAAGKGTIKMPRARVGDFCFLTDALGGQLRCEIVSLENDEATIIPLGSADGIAPGATVRLTGMPLQIEVGDHLLGQVVDAFAQPLEKPFEIKEEPKNRAINQPTENPLNRPVIDEQIATGVRVIDGLLPLGSGQRVCIIGEAGSGKSSLLGMISRGTECDVCVLALIGERGREVNEFLKRELPESIRSKTVTVVSTADKSPLERVAAGKSATAIAEYFRDKGKNVLLLFDSMTRYARALREARLAVGEMPTRGGFPASVFSEIPMLLERTGKTKAGSITAIYTLLSTDDAAGDVLAEEVQSLTDGHIVLSKQRSNAGQFPAIDVLQSASRLQGKILTKEQNQSAISVRTMLQKADELKLLVQVGEYREGTDALGDKALKAKSDIESFLFQSHDEISTLDDTRKWLEELAQ